MTDSKDCEVARTWWLVTSDDTSWTEESTAISPFPEALEEHSNSF